MTSMHDDDDFFDLPLDEWRAERPTEGFASAVVRAVELERAGRRAAWLPRGVVVPLLLAALLVSLGAAAALNQRAEVSTSSLEETPSEPPLRVPRTPRIAFHPTSEPVRAEPEPSAQAPRSESPPAPRFVAPIEVTEEEAPVAIPRAVHFPRCECGTSGVVCACTD